MLQDLNDNVRHPTVRDEDSVEDTADDKVDNPRQPRHKGCSVRGLKDCEMKEERKRHRQKAVGIRQDCEGI